MVAPSRIDPKELATALGMQSDGLEAGHHLRGITPRYSRVQIPLDDVVSLRHYADLLRGLAMQLDLISRRADLSDAQALWFAKGEVKSTQSKLLDVWKSVRQK